MNVKEIAEIMRNLLYAKKNMREYEYYRKQNEEALKRQKTGLPQTDNFNIRYMGIAGSLLRSSHHYGARVDAGNFVENGNDDLMSGIWRGYLLKARND